MRLHAAYQAGIAEGQRRESYHSDARRREIADLQRRVSELTVGPAPAEPNRYFEIDGAQVVEVGRYAYRWSGDEPLTVGDKVMLPQNWVSEMTDGPGPFSGTVTRLGSTYTGALSSIIRKVSP